MYTENKAVNVAAVNTARKANAATLLTEMETQCKNWHAVDKKTTAELYSLLAECLRFCKLFVGTDCDKVLKNFYKARNLKFKASAQFTTKVIHAVFGGVDRKRVSTYALVVNTLIRDNITYNDVAAYITKNGGINAIKNTNGGGKTAADKVKLATDFIKDTQLAVISGEQLVNAISVNVDVDGEANTKKTCVLIAEITVDGNFTIHAAVQKNTVISAALIACYDKNKELIDAATKGDYNVEVDDWFSTEILTEEVIENVNATDEVASVTDDAMEGDMENGDMEDNNMEGDMGGDVTL
jgi:hypothetical protein